MISLLNRRRIMMGLGGDEWDNYAIQTLDSTKPNYNPAVAIILNDNSIGTVIDNPVVSGEGRYSVLKSEASNINIDRMFNSKTTVTDTNGIVTSDTTATYDFSSFDEYQYFKPVNPGDGNNTTGGAFGSCSKLTSLKLPEGITTFGRFTFLGCTALKRITIPMSFTTFGSYNFALPNYTPNLYHVYYNGTLEQWMNITIVDSPCINGAHFYIGGEELTQLTIPQNVTTIKNKIFQGMQYITGAPNIPDIDVGQAAFAGCSSLIGNAYIHNGGNECFSNCTGLTDVTIFGTGFPTMTRGAGDGTGTLTFYSNLEGSSQGVDYGLFKKVICYGNINNTTGYGFFTKGYGITEVFRIKGNAISGGNGALTSQAYSTTTKFIEIEGTFVKNLFYNVNYTYNGFIEHFGYNGIAGTAANAQVSSARCAKVYVGDGVSKSADEAILSLYTNDKTNRWSSYASKLATWWDYNGEYKWYRVTENLTNCINTNTDVWPHITRHKSYQTTLVPNEGYTITSVTVEMYEANDNGTTPTNPQQLSNVYDSLTGDIKIHDVIGNIIITASATANS